MLPPALCGGAADASIEWRIAMSATTRMLVCGVICLAGEEECMDEPSVMVPLCRQSCRLVWVG